MGCGRRQCRFVLPARWGHGMTGSHVKKPVILGAIDGPRDRPLLSGIGTLASRDSDAFPIVRNGGATAGL